MHGFSAFGRTNTLDPFFDAKSFLLFAFFLQLPAPTAFVLPGFYAFPPKKRGRSSLPGPLSNKSGTVPAFGSGCFLLRAHAESMMRSRPHCFARRLCFQRIAPRLFSARHRLPLHALQSARGSRSQRQQPFSLAVPVVPIASNAKKRAGVLGRHAYKSESGQKEQSALTPAAPPPLSPPSAPAGTAPYRPGSLRHPPVAALAACLPRRQRRSFANIPTKFVLPVCARRTPPAAPCPKGRPRLPFP